MYDALTLRRISYVARDLSKRGSDGRFSRRRMPGRFALRFTDERGDDGQAVNRRASGHRAFNSPFWPFVLASTSVGQEGLDFHLYSHAVMHWNLPANPVDLEQREGRVHRYKGHAVRKNVATVCRASASGGDDPWASLFAAAGTLRRDGQPTSSHRGSSQRPAEPESSAGSLPSHSVASARLRTDAAGRPGRVPTTKVLRRRGRAAVGGIQD
jgi:hypothetical protein